MAESSTDLLLAWKTDRTRLSQTDQRLARGDVVARDLEALTQKSKRSAEDLSRIMSLRTSLASLVKQAQHAVDCAAVDDAAMQRFCRLMEKS